MANQYYDVRVDVSKSEVLDSGLRFTQGDSNVIFLRIAVMNGGSKFDASNTTPSVCFVKPDGTYVVGTPVASNDVWVYQFLGNELQAAGNVLCDVKFTYSSGRISSSKFTFFVEKDTTIPAAQASSSYILPMEEALAEMNNYKQQGETMAEAAESYALDSEAWAIGERDGTPVTSADETYENNSKYYAAQAKIYEENAAAIVGIGIATTSTAGIVKPDGTTITVGLDGTIAAVGGGGGGDMYKSEFATNGNSGIVDKATTLNDGTNALTATITELNTLDGVTADASEINVLDGITATTAELNILDGVTASASELNILDGATLSTTELNYVDGVTSGIQTQLNGKAASDHTHTLTMATDSGTSAVDLAANTKYKLTAGGSTLIFKTPPSDGGDTVSIAGHGTASASVTHEQQITINSTAYDIDGTKYMEQTANSASFTFTNAAITANSVIDVYTDTWGDNPSTVTASSGSCSVTFASASTRTVRIYIR